MPQKSKRQVHSTAISYAFLRKRGLESEHFSGSSEGGFDVDTTDSSQERSSKFQDKITGDDMSDLFEHCKLRCPVKYLSVLVYMTLRKFGVSWINCDNFLRQMGAFTVETSHKWTEVFISGDLDEFQGENHGGRYFSEFYDFFPELEDAAKQYTLERCSEKSASFTVVDLAKFIDKKFYETTNIIKDPESPLIRSLSSCRLDLRRWGARYNKNSQRPYFEGHERIDVVDHLQQFINYFLDRKDFYYTVTDDDKPLWKLSTQTPPCILIFHDESTFKSGEVSAKRWFFGEEAPFHSKRRGRSNMVSDFLVQHNSGPFFSLSQSEYEKALAKHPQLDGDLLVNHFSFLNPMLMRFSCVFFQLIQI
ncbi:unnamed protein product [Rotaria socialis]|uniref:Uncharacterized protein n=1 Tax=Rotaria socialis TaxID=392032 RepID=A0A817NVK2_9BILA|nr:unnamed protein product [Rotaria socialis]CAF3394576.1 unnamed protein product [Rotaria socialis]CAF3484950.1 unnamed protein product [Rotaria socialis]CAF3696303.1 unnamed protein product [Rotaria socialis]